jgi:hypothetical protein
MPSYAIESYSASSTVETQRERAQLVAVVGTGVPYVRTTFLPGDETVLHLFEARSSDALGNAALPYERIVEVGL